MADLEDDRDLVKEEIHHWKTEWQDVAEKDRPNTAASALKACDKRRFPNVKRLLRILCTLPLTSAECERTFSCMRRLKSYLRSTAGRRFTLVGEGGSGRRPLPPQSLNILVGLTLKLLSLYCIVGLV